MFDLAQQALLARIAAQMPDLAQVSAYGGEFDADEPGRAHVVSPACLLAFAGVTVLDDPGTEEVDCRLDWETFLVIRHAGGTAARATAALAWLARLVQVLNGYSEAAAGIHSPLDLARGRNHYGSTFDRAGVAVLSLAFSHRTRLGENVWDAPGGVLPREVYFSHAPEIGAAHEAEYEEVTP